MDMDPLRVIALILIGSFAIDRVVAGLFFLLSYSDDLRASLDPALTTDPRRQADARRTYKLLYAIFGGYLGIVVLAGYMHIRLFASTSVPGSDLIGQHPLLDIVLTGLVLVGGADRLSEAMRMLGGAGGRPQEPPPPPIQIEGTLVLERGDAHPETVLPAG